MVNRFRKTINCLRRRCGYSIIEILVVMSLLGITITLVSAAYLSFERRERVKSAALDLKSNLRLAQNKALSGDKGVPGTAQSCVSPDTLIGWYVRVDIDENSYDIVGDCLGSGGEIQFETITVDLPKDVSITNVLLERETLSDLNVGALSINVLFRPLELEVYSFNDNSNFSPDVLFLNSDGELDETLMVGGSADEQSALILRVEGFGVIYDVMAAKTGEISEKRFNGNGQSLIEVVISIALAAILAISLISTTLITQRTSQSARNNTEATKLAQEWIEQIRVYRDRHDFERLYSAPAGEPQPSYCRIDTTGDPDDWKLRGSVCPVEIVKGTVIFRRLLNITETVPVDPDKRVITVTVSWDEPGGQKQVVHDTVLSRWESF